MNENVRDGMRCSPSLAYLRPVMGNNNLTVLTKARAVDLTLAGTHCTGLDFLCKAVPCRTYPARFRIGYGVDASTVSASRRNRWYIQASRSVAFVGSQS